MIRIKDLKEWKGETFSFFHLTFDVEKAIELVKNGKHDIQRIDVKKNAPTILNFQKDIKGNILWTEKDKRAALKRDKQITMNLGTGFDLDHYMKTNVNEPGIVATYQGNPILIDGNNRLAKAYKLGIKFFRVYILTEKETKSIMKKNL